MKDLHNQIRLEILDAANWRASLELEVRPEQQAFVAAYSPITAIMLAKAYVRAGGREWEPLAIVAGDQMIGALALSVGPEDRDQCWLFHYFIDRRYQARGYGKAGLQALFSYVRERRPECRSLDLLVHPQNLPAQALYHSQGFEPSGRLIEGDLHYRKHLDHKKSPLEL